MRYVEPLLKLFILLSELGILPIGFIRVIEVIRVVKGPFGLSSGDHSDHR